MGRPKKNTVDWFPHQCTHKKTMFIIEQRFGNDGYSFWFKLLETLGGTEGHCLDLREPETLEFLKAITRLQEEKFFDILNLLAKLNAIDRELWKKKIIWSKNFVEGISSVYRNRGVEVPQKPSINKKKKKKDDKIQIDYGMYKKEWNELAEESGLSKVREITSSRKNHIRTRVKHNKDFFLDFQKAIFKLKDSKNLKSKKWLTFDFMVLIQKGQHGVGKILEGKYDWLEEKAKKERKAGSKYDGQEEEV